MKNIPIGQILVENGFLKEDQLEEALEKQRSEPGKKLGDVLLELGYVSETQLAQALSIRLKVPFIDLTTTKIDIEAVKKIPEAIAKKNCCVAFQMNDSRLTVATDDPINFYIFEELKVISGMEIHAMIATRTAINETISKAYSQQTVSNVMDNLNKEYNNATDNVIQDDPESGERVDNAPIVKLVNTIVETSFRMNASDIHIEPFKDRTRIRLRVDGELIEQMKVKPAAHNSLITRIKILGGMNIAEKRIPLDGRFGMTIDGVNLDVRVSTIPTVYGEKCVIRLLSTADEKTRKITDLGMTLYNYEMFKQIIRCPHGVMLVTGPTGSGKSTLVQHMNGLLFASSGIVDVFDQKVIKSKKVKLKPIRKHVGLVFQFSEYQLFESTVLQDIMFGPKNFGKTKEEAYELAINACKLIGIPEDLYERSPFSLSGGQMRRVAIAGALAIDPDILILDEPTVGLDPKGKEELMNLLVDIQNKTHKSIIMITHDMNIVAKYAKRVLVMNHGKLVYDGNKHTLFENQKFLEKYNLDLPNIASVAKELKERQLIDFDTLPLTKEDLYKVIVKEEKNNE